MEIKIKNRNKNKFVKFETSAEIKEVIIEDNFINPENEIISICFRGKNSSGILNLKASEIKELNNTIQDRTNLIKSVKKFN